MNSTPSANDRSLWHRLVNSKLGRRELLKGMAITGLFLPIAQENSIKYAL